MLIYISIMCTKQTNTENPVMFAPVVVGRGTPTISTAIVTRGTPTAPTSVTAPQGNADRSPPTPSGPQASSMDHATMKLDGKYLT